MNRISEKENSLTPHYRVLVVGAGPAGSSLALTLARNNISVVLVEAGSYQKSRVGELLSPEAVETLLDLVPDLSQEHLKFPLSIASAWGSGDLKKDEPRSETPWRAIERLTVDRSLAQEAQKFGAGLHLKTRVRRPVRVDGRWEVGLENQETGEIEQVTTDLLIDATGRAALLAKHFGAVRLRQNGQVALVGFLESDEATTPPLEMVLETTSQGWWYAAPIKPGAAVAIFITDNDLEKGAAEDSWSRALAESQHIRARFGEFTLTERPRRVAADSSLLVPSCGEGWMAVGDAAACFDPLSERGIGRAIARGQVVGNYLIECFSQGLVPNPIKLAEDNGGEFLEGSVELSFAYSQVTQWPDSAYWNRRHRGRPGEVEWRHPKKLPRKVAVTWGRGATIEEYQHLEALLLGHSDLNSAIRSFRWNLCCWACEGHNRSIDWDFPNSPALPEMYLLWLEELLVLSTFVCQESAYSQDDNLFAALVDDTPTSFERFDWEGRFSDLNFSEALMNVDWLQENAEQYQRSLIEMKFLIVRTPLVHNLCILAVLPTLLHLYSLLFSLKRHSKIIEQADFDSAVDLLESDLISEGGFDRLNQGIVGLQIEEALKAQNSTKK